MPVHLASEEQFDPYSFVKYVKVIGRAYQRRAIELVTICRLFVEASPQEVQRDAQFKEAMLAADVALRLATEAGKKLTDTASNAFEEAQKALLRYEKSVHPRYTIVAAGMAQAKERDLRSLGFFNRLIARRGVHTPNEPPTLPINFVLLKSLTEPKPLIVHQMLSAQPKSSEILWNFSRYTDDRRIALRQNPHFYLDLPTSRDDYGPEFFKKSTKDFGLKRNATVYVLVDKLDLGRIYLEVEANSADKQKKRIFGNVWTPKDVMIFKDICGTLEGENLVEKDIQSPQKLFWRNEPEIHDISLKDSSAIPRKSSTPPEVPWNPVADIEDWKELIREKTLPSSRSSVKICVNRANHPVVTSDKPANAPDKHAAGAPSQRPYVPSATNPTHASPSVHAGTQDANPEVLTTHGGDTQCLPQTQVHSAPLASVPPIRHTDSKSIAVTVPSPPVPMSSVSPPAPAHARGSPIAATPHTTIQSSSPLPAHHSKPPATQGLRSIVPQPQAPVPPSSFPGTNPNHPSKPIDVTPITNSRPENRTVQHSHPQPASNNTQPRFKEQHKPAPIQTRTKVDKPAQDGKGPMKSTKFPSISISSIAHKIKLPSMPGAFPGPQMDVDWIMVSPGPGDTQGGNWLKRLFRRPG